DKVIERATECRWLAHCECAASPPARRRWQCVHSTTCALRFATPNELKKEEACKDEASGRWQHLAFPPRRGPRPPSPPPRSLVRARRARESEGSLYRTHDQFAELDALNSMQAPPIAPILAAELLAAFARYCVARIVFFPQWHGRPWRPARAP